ncbi:unnamed protein product [Acanthoscelides obtectus]|uniref:Uncharacterized protein n=1 Tax=Acanthoscelides obtectus TaxID=200917 RepID=A0A9P0LCS5_ACAOB|nr:unnamed protein product [Acanthoscelides obtectus]CAK1650115.1 hypothetical protein AOBTE_LOCUS16607 [Acanthoscelides obtectus]
MNVKSYVWLEHEYPKNSNAIASAVHETLIKFNFGAQIEEVHLFADGCGGQNKNSTMMAMIMYWLTTEAPKNIKKRDIIINRKQYEDIIGQHSKVLKLGAGWDVFDWKTKTDNVLKKPSQWYFKCNESKRFIFLKEKDYVTLRGEVFYKSDMGCAKTIVRKSKKIAQLKPSIQRIGSTLRGDKSSIDSLLKKHYGADWRDNTDLDFYKIIDTTIQKTLLWKLAT